MHHSYDNGAGINAVADVACSCLFAGSLVNYYYQLTYYEMDPVDVGVQLNFDIISQGMTCSLLLTSMSNGLKCPMNS